MTKTILDEIATMTEMARAPGEDGIPAEVWKHGGNNLFSRLHQCLEGGFCTTSMEGCKHRNHLLER